MSQLPPPPAYPPPPPAYPPPPPTTRRRALPVVLAVIAAVLVVAVVVTVPVAMDRTRAGDGSDGSVNLDDVQVYDDLEVTHTSEDVDYPQSPPVGGPHAPVWLDCGVYDEPVRDENAVHDLEHGTVWIAYDPGADVDVDALAEALPQNGLLSPYDDLDAPVVVTVWGRQLVLDGAGDPRLELFIDRYGGGETAPEPFASCAGGVRAAEGDPGTSI